MRRKRPFGVTIIAIVQALSGPTAGLGIVFSGVHLTAAFSEGQIDLTAVGLSLAGLGIAVGLWRLKHWAWVAAMLWTGAALAGALFAYLRGHPDYPLMIGHIITVFYLNQHEVQEAFGSGLPVSGAPA